jgi:hypothetical protein
MGEAFASPTLTVALRKILFGNTVCAGCQMTIKHLTAPAVFDVTGQKTGGPYLPTG